MIDINKYDMSGEYGIGYAKDGTEFIFDKKDYDLISPHTWVADRWKDKNGRESIYLACTIKRRKVRLHRFLLGVTDPSVQVDHINHDTLDYRRSNLRKCSNKENNRNKGLTKNNNSGIVGVYYDKKRNKWCAEITVDYKKKFLGYYDDIDDAAKARRNAEELYFGEYAYKEEKRKERFKIKPYQAEALEKMHNGCVLKGDVGTGKSFTSILYYWTKVCGGIYTETEYKPMTKPRPLYIITTARKRDSHEWEKDMMSFLLSPDDSVNPYSKEAPVIIDSYNNIKKYTKVYGAFFIFDEQKLSGKGAWVKSFLKIANKNQWILLSATPFEKWEHAAPMFIANGFYKNLTDFRQQHIEYNQFTPYPSVKGYHNVGKLIKYRNAITVNMIGEKPTTQHHEDILCCYDKTLEEKVLKERWHVFENRPLLNAAEMSLCMRRIVFGDESRTNEVLRLYQTHPRMIIFYDYDFELEMLREMCDDFNIVHAEWNGHKHEPVPEDGNWVYLCQYTSSAEAWETNKCSTMVFFNNNFSYSVMKQAAGRIDRTNTPYKDLYYYHLTSKSYIDKRVSMALKQKKKFNELRDFRQYFD